MKYLIIGSEGQIGKTLKDFLIKNNQKVVGIDKINKKEEDASNPEYFNEEFISQFDYVFFLAFDVGGSRYLKKYQNTFEFIHNNISLMKNVFEVLEKTKKPFLFTSSQMSNMSYSPYGILKKTGEIYTENLDGLIVKFWNVYGQENDLEKSHVITDFINKAKEGVIDMLTSGKESRQFLYAEDCCEALFTLSLKHNELDKTKNYHITSFVWSNILEIANIIQQNIPCDIIPGPVEDEVQLDAKNEPDTFILNYWQPKTSLEEGIKKIILCQ